MNDLEQEVGGSARWQTGNAVQRSAAMYIHIVRMRGGLGRPLDTCGQTQGCGASASRRRRDGSWEGIMSVVRRGGGPETTHLGSLDGGNDIARQKTRATPMPLD